MDNSRARYIEINVKCYEGHRSYEEDVPVFLHKRPSQMVAYIFKEHWHTTIIGKKDNDGIPRKVYCNKSFFPSSSLWGQQQSTTVHLPRLEALQVAL